jgi:hypothetical protein
MTEKKHPVMFTPPLPHILSPHALRRVIHQHTGGHDAGEVPVPNDGTAATMRIGIRNNLFVIVFPLLTGIMK